MKIHSVILGWTVAVFAAVFSFGASAQSQAYPTKSVRLIIPFPPGGSSDLVARVLATKLSNVFGQTFYVDHRGGAMTTVGTAELTKAPADGHTLLMTASTHVINPLLMKSLPYDSEKDFEPVSTVIKSEFVLVAHPSLAANNLQEFIALAKSQTGKMDYAISGYGNANHLAGELFGEVAGIKLQAVPYKGGGPAINDLLGGQVKLMFSVPVSVIPHVKAGKLKALGYTGKNPLRDVKVPTFAEGGLPQFDMSSWQGILVRAGTPKPIIDRLAGEIAKILKDPEVHELLTSQGQEPFISTVSDFAELLKADREKYGAIIKRANIKLD